MTNRTSSSTILFAVLMLALSGCQRAIEPTVVSNGQPSQGVLAEPAQMQQGTIRDPSLPDASSVFAAEAAAEKAKADALAAQQAEPSQPPAAPANDIAQTSAADKPLSVGPVDAVPATRVN